MLLSMYAGVLSCMTIPISVKKVASPRRVTYSMMPSSLFSLSTAPKSQTSADDTTVFPCLIAECRQSYVSPSRVVYHMRPFSSSLRSRPRTFCHSYLDTEVCSKSQCGPNGLTYANLIDLPNRSVTRAGVHRILFIQLPRRAAALDETGSLT